VKGRNNMQKEVKCECFSWGNFTEGRSKALDFVNSGKRKIISINEIVTGTGELQISVYYYDHEETDAERLDRIRKKILDPECMPRGIPSDPEERRKMAEKYWGAVDKVLKLLRTGSW
jgi:hypothetical protein